jgi:hypothetical protein
MSALLGAIFKPQIESEEPFSTTAPQNMLIYESLHVFAGFTNSFLSGHFNLNRELRATLRIFLAFGAGTIISPS